MRYLLVITSFLWVQQSFANGTQYDSYDDIVYKLSNYNKKSLKENSAYRPEIRTNSLAHAGIGFTQTFYDADATQLNSNLQNQGGVLLALGVDLLNSRWGVEGTYSNFGRNTAKNTNLKLKEFTIRGLYKPSINKHWNMKLGLGVSSRFLGIKNSEINQEYKTPSGIFSVGIDSYINSFISVGADFSFKTAMIQDTVDKNSADLSVRIDTHF